MKIPDISIINSGTWHNSKKQRKTAARFVLTYEVEFLRKMSGEMTINGTVYNTSKNSLVFCRPGDIRVSRFDTDYSVEIDFFYFITAPEKNSTFEDILSRIPAYIDADDELIAAWERLAEAANQSTHTSDMQAHLNLLLLLACLSEHSSDGNGATHHSSQQQAIFEAIRYMNENLTEKLSVVEIAAHIGYSPSRFNSIFKELTGYTPHAYYLSLKIMESKYMLLNTDMSISEISAALAFSKVSKFGAAFKKECHMTPGQFRKNRERLFYYDA